MSPNQPATRSPGLLTSRPGASTQKLPRLARLAGPHYGHFLGSSVLARALFEGTRVFYPFHFEVGTRRLAPPLAHEQYGAYSPHDENRERYRNRSGFDQKRGEGGEDGRDRYGKDPRPRDAAGHAPPHSAKPARRAGAQHGTGHDLRRAHGQPPCRGELDDRRRDRLGREPMDRLHPDDPGTHRTYDAPAARPCPEADRDRGGEGDPRRYFELRKVSRAKQGEGYDGHRLLCVVGPVAERDETTREELKLAEGAIGRARACPTEEVEEHDGNDVSDHEPHDG